VPSKAGGLVEFVRSKFPRIHKMPVEETHVAKSEKLNYARSGECDGATGCVFCVRMCEWRDWIAKCTRV